MSEQEISGGAGRDQYNISGNKAKLKVDNRTNVGVDKKPIVEIAIGVAIVVIGGYLLFLFGWN